MRDPRFKFRALVLILSALFLFSSGHYAQEAGTLGSKVSTILAKFPAENSTDKDLCAAELLSLGPKGLRDVCRRLAAPGTDDDSLARFAVDAVAAYVMRPGAEAERLMFIKELLKALAEPGNTDVKIFLISQIQLAGKREAVKPLGKFLKDSKLCGPAARALVAIRTSDAEGVFIKALGRAPLANKINVVQALGELRSAAAVKKIMPFASMANENLRLAALAALANIGDVAALPALEKITVTASPYDRAKAASLYLLFGQRLWESGKKDAAEKICRDFIKNSTAAGESQVRASALSLLARILGPDILDVLLEAVDSADSPFRQRALEIADSIPGEAATARWIEKISKTQPEAQAEIIAMLGRRGDKSAFPVVRDKLRSEDKAVRLAAITAAAKFGGAEVFDEIWPLIQTEDEDQVKATKQALLTFPAGQVVAKAAALLGEAPPHARAALIEILAERRAREQAGLILAQARSENEVIRRASLRAIETLGRAEDVPQIIDLLLTVSAAPELTLIQNGLVAAANQVANPEMRADEILAALEKTQGSKRVNLMRPLARIGGTKALQFIIAETKGQDPSMQTAALLTLANWLDASASEELFKIARAAADRRSRYLALQGITRLSQDAALSFEQKLQFLKEAIEIAVETEEKNFVISALANVRTMESLKTAAKFLDDPLFQVKAAQAILGMALPSAGAEGLAGRDTAIILKKAALFIDNEYDKGQAEKYVQEILAKDGFSRLFNGKNLAGWKGLVADPVKRARMTPAELAKAQREADEIMRQHWKVIDGALVFDGKGHSLCTLKDYGDFEMFVDWKIGPKGDSGVYLRGSPQVQIWDPAQSPEGSGGLYNNKINPAKPLVPADRPVGEWNTFYIKMVGERVTVYLNGVLVVDNVVMENYWERDKPIYPVGQLELQAHSTPLFFKNIYLRELSTENTARNLSAR